MTWLERLGRALDLLFAPLLMLLLIGPALIVEIWTDKTFIVSHSTFIFAVGWGLVLLGAAVRALRGLPVLGSGADGGRLWLLVVAGWLALTSLLAYQPAITWFAALGVLSYMLLGQTVRDWLQADPQRRRWPLAALAGVVGIQLVVGAQQFFKLPLDALVKAVPVWTDAEGRVLPGGAWLHDLLFSLSQIGGQGFVVGTLGNYNYLAEFLVLALPVLVGAALSLRAGWLRWGAIAGLVPAFLLLFSTGGRGALLGLLVGLVAAAFLAFGGRWVDPRRWWQSPRSRGVAIAVMVLLAGAIAFGGGRFHAKLTAVMSGSDNSITARLINWQAAAAIVADRPVFGTGVGGFRLLNVERLAAAHPEGLPKGTSLRFHQAHNEPLQAAVELGIPGLLLLVGGLMAWVRQVRRNELLPQSLRFGLLWGVIAVLVAGIFGFPFHIPLTALALTLTLAVGATPSAPEAAPIGLRLRPAYALMAVLIVGTAGTLFFQKHVWPNYLAHRYYKVGEHVEKKDRQSPAGPAIFALADRYLAFKGEVVVPHMKFLLQRGRYEEALQVYEAGEKRGLGLDALYWKARALKELGRMPEAEAAYTRVLHYYPEDDPYHIMSERMLKRLKRAASTPS